MKGRPIPSSTFVVARRATVALLLLMAGSAGPLSAQASGIVLGVLPFDATRIDSTLRSLGFGIADLIATDIAMITRLRVVERGRLGDVLREQQLARGAAFDPSRAPRVGQLLKANRLLAGSLIANRSNQLVFQARLINAINGTVDTAVNATASLTDILEAEKQLTFQVLDRMGVVITPRERSLIEQRPTRNLAALLAYGQGVEEEINGNFAAARRSFRRAATLDPSFRGATNRQRQSEAIALRTEGTVVQGVIDLVSPTQPIVPRQPPPGNPITSPVSRGTLIITIKRP